MGSSVSAYNDWKLTSPELSCLFARMIALRPEDYKQIVEVVSQSDAPQRVASRIDSRIEELVADPAAVAAALLLPGIATLEALLRTFMALRNVPGWRVTLEQLDGSPINDLLRCRVTRLIPKLGGELIESEALVLGNFVEFPKTRQAPLTALEMYVGIPRDADPKTGEAAVKANLAHIGMTVPDHTFKKMWNKTMDMRLAALDGIDDPRAKAKSSFVIPASLAESVGFWP